MGRWIGLVALVLLVSRPTFPCEPSVVWRWYESVFERPQYQELDDVVVISGSPLFIGREPFGARPHIMRRIAPGEALESFERVDVSLVEDSDFVSLAPHQRAYRLASPLEPGEYRGGTTIIVDPSAVDTPNPVAEARARIVHVPASGGCDRSDCGPTRESYYLDIEFVRPTPELMDGNHLVTIRNKKTGAIRHEVLGPGLATDRSDEMIDLEHDTICVTLAGLGWEGAVGESVDLGCHSAP